MLTHAYSSSYLGKSHDMFSFFFSCTQTLTITHAQTHTHAHPHPQTHSNTHDNTCSNTHAHPHPQTQTHSNTQSHLRKQGGILVARNPFYWSEGAQCGGSFAENYFLTCPKMGDLVRACVCVRVRVCMDVCVRVQSSESVRQRD